jgi:hypothetical protein
MFGAMEESHLLPPLAPPGKHLVAILGASIGDQSHRTQRRYTELLKSSKTEMFGVQSEP